MARSSRRSASTTDDAIDQMLSLPPAPTVTSTWSGMHPVVQAYYDAMQLEDLRQFHPDPARPATELPGRRARIIERPAKIKWGRIMYPQSYAKARMGYAHPENVITCLRRKARKEIMFALGLRKKGSGAGRRKRNHRSNIKC